MTKLPYSRIWCPELRRWCESVSCRSSQVCQLEKAEKTTPSEQLDRVWAGIADSIMDLSDDDLLAEARAEGIDIDAELERIRQVIIKAKQGRQQ